MEKTTKNGIIGKIIYAVGALAVLALNLLAWKSTEFCDWYIDHIFPIWLNTYARLTSALSISVGEIMLILAVGITAFGIGFFIYNLLCKRKYHVQLRRFGRVYAWIVLAVAGVMTLNCFILYHATGFAKQYMVKETGTMVVDCQIPQYWILIHKGKMYTRKKILQHSGIIWLNNVIHLL